MGQSTGYDAASQLRYRIEWMERGRLRSHEATANIVAIDYGRTDGEVERWCARVDAILHAQILIDH